MVSDRPNTNSDSRRSPRRAFNRPIGILVQGHYLVVEAGVWTVGNSRIKIEADIVADVSRVNCRTCGSWNNGTDVSYRNAYSAEPVVLHQVMSANDASWIT